MPLDDDHRETWTAPPRRRTRRSETDVPGALGGSRLWDQPAMAAARAELDTFVATPGPLAVEVGFDHGITLLANARAWPDWRWLGAEIRRRRVDAVRPHAPANCLPLRVDARTLFASLLPDGRVARVDVLFPTPVEQGHHLLLTAAFVADVARVLAPDGVLHIATDVRGLADLATDLLAGWRPAADPPPSPERSRRERVCQRDGLPVWRFTRAKP
ncbi:MAG: hypothetical protein H6742_14600 [Alphaproteobacteria bacterium]|nr:hypothetical protein [Alphaproteobacteria bacterium]